MSLRKYSKQKWQNEDFVPKEGIYTKLHKKSVVPNYSRGGGSWIFGSIPNKNHEVFFVSPYDHSVTVVSFGFVIDTKQHL